MRTTVNIDAGLLETAKRRANQRNMTLGELVEAGLRRMLAQADDDVAQGPPLPVFTGGTGMASDIDPTSNSSMLDALDEEDDAAIRAQARAAG